LNREDAKEDTKNAKTFSLKGLLLFFALFASWRFNLPFREILPSRRGSVGGRADR